MLIISSNVRISPEIMSPPLSWRRCQQLEYSIHTAKLSMNWERCGRKQQCTNRGNILEFTWSVWGKPRNSICVQGGYQPEHLPNVNREHHHYTEHFGPAVPHAESYRKPPPFFMHREVWSRLVFEICWVRFSVWTEPSLTADFRAFIQTRQTNAGIVPGLSQDKLFLSPLQILILLSS
jgi:hypothetical protein